MTLEEARQFPHANKGNSDGFSYCIAYDYIDQPILWVKPDHMKFNNYLQ